MLVLRRKVGETVVIEGVGRIMLCSANDGRVSLGFDMDRRFNIAREELLGFTPAPPVASDAREAVVA